jgi:glyoxylase-like metal-dependent hydrolase (beta-lactamase superfamily II)
MPTWTEIADGVYHRRYDPLDISICLVRGTRGLLLVDTRCNAREAEEILADAASLSDLPIRWVVNTHAHYDHTFGNRLFAGAATIYGHHLIPAHFAEYEAPRLATWLADPAAQPQHDWRGVELVAPTQLVSEPTTIDIGGRAVRLVPLEPGHTDTDLVIHVPDADVWIVGDVVEESGPPMFGSGSFPFGWPGVLEELSAAMDEEAMVVPGHGRVVDPGFLRDQARTLRAIADGIAESFARSEPVEFVSDRLAASTSLPLEIIEAAVLRGYTLLGDGRRSSPTP